MPDEYNAVRKEGGSHPTTHRVTIVTVIVSRITRICENEDVTETSKKVPHAYVQNRSA